MQPWRRLHCRPRPPQRAAALLLALILLAPGNPLWDLVTPAAPGPHLSAATPPDVSPPVPPVHTVQPPVDPHLPGLSVTVRVDPDPVLVGQPATLIVTLTNSAPDPARDLDVTLPVPGGASAPGGPTISNTAPLPGPATTPVPPPLAWHWSQPTLAPHTSTTFTGSVLVSQPPASGALILTPTIVAQGIAQPITATGGALVRDPAAGSASQPYTPGSTATVRSSDGRVTVDVPAKAASLGLTLTHSLQPPPGEPAPPAQAGFKKGFGAFHLSATDGGGNRVQQFAQPVTLTVHYTPEQLQARGISEPDLTLFWFNPDGTYTMPGGVSRHGDWVPIATRVDTATHTAQVSVTHFSAFQLSDGSSPSSLYLPSLKGWQVDTFTGHASYGIPIAVPAGPGGIKPELTLAYDSGQSDGATGKRLAWQSSWVGKGWSLGESAVELVRPSDKTPVMYRLVLGGRSYDLAREAGASSDPYNADPTQFTWKVANENFLRVQVSGNGTSTNQSGGTAAPRYQWSIWDKGGTRYDFVQDLWWGFDECDPNQFASPTAWMETYKWQVTTVTDANGNMIHYHYPPPTQVSPGATSCNGVNGSVDVASVPDWIAWGSNTHVAGSVDQFRALFTSATRGHDTQHDSATVQYGGNAGGPQQTQQLLSVAVQTAGDGASWHLVRRYDFGYSWDLLPDVFVDGITSTYWKLTLRSVILVGSDGTSALPATTFDYLGSAYPGSGTYIPGGANRLSGVDNHQGGVVTFAYENIATAVGNGYFDNYHRVTSVTTSDRGTTVGTWHYAYQNPELASLGSDIGGLPLQQFPNSAALYLNAKWPVQSGFADNTPFLAVPPNTEFRGHVLVGITAPNGQLTNHYFHQGGAGCDPTATGSDFSTYNQDGCFTNLRVEEAERGVERQTDLFDASGHLLTSTLWSHGVDATWDSTDFYTIHALSGVWHDFTHPTSRTEILYEGSATGQGDPNCASSLCTRKTTNYFYDPSYQSTGGQYGNLTKVEERNPDGTLLRRSERWFNTQNSASAYIVNRVWQEAASTGTSAPYAYQALTTSFYDNQLSAPASPTQGRLTLTRRYYDIPTSGDISGTLHGTDSGAAYDDYGNPINTIAYTSPGTRVSNGASYGPAGGGVACACITHTFYDPTFHDLPIEVDTPPIAGNANAPLVEHAGYDANTRWITSVTDPTNNSTLAGYDVWGRITDVVKPGGDTLSAPTVHFTYYDFPQTGQPVLSTTQVRETVGQPNFHFALTFSDGLGRTIQTKRESTAGTQQIVSDTVYDAMSNPIQVSQPRYWSVPSGHFFDYTALDPPNERWTTTTYDALNRPLVVTAPDSTTTQASYGRDTIGATASAIDANNHKTSQETNLFGRLLTVTEYSGTGQSGDPYATYATTHYAYTPLDLLMTVTDTANHVTSATYDSLGRKTAMSDPDLGQWTYQYDAVGNLTSQTDAKNQTIGMGYDALNRLIAQTGGLTATYTYDQGANGKGHRTAAANGSATVFSTYDARGRVTALTTQVAGQSGQSVLTTGYNDADKVTTLTYPSNETVTYTYDAAWRPTSVCSSIGNLCYASAATYTALDQPASRTFGNTLLAQWTYTSPLARLQRLQVGASTSQPSTVYDRTYTYDAVGNVTLMHNGLVTEDQAFAYDHHDRLTRACTASPTDPQHTCNTTLNSTGYDESDSYDPLGNLMSKGSTGAATTYTYTGSGHVHAPASITPTGGTAKAFTYDLNGNTLSDARSGRSITWDARNLPLTITTTPPAYTPPTQLPNLTAPSRGGTGQSGSPNLTAPARGGATVTGTPNLTAPTRPVNTTPTTETYTYDADGTRVTRAAGGITTLYIGGVYEVDIPAGVTRTQYGFGGGVVAQREVSGSISTVVYLHGDHLGSISVATASDGSVKEQQEFGPWGTIRSGWVSTTSLNYTGQKRDGTGLLYYGARYYDPVLGRFLSADSIWGNRADPQSLNPFSYVRNNPMNRTDPTGNEDVPGGTPAGVSDSGRRENCDPCASGNNFDPNGGLADAFAHDWSSVGNISTPSGGAVSTGGSTDTASFAPALEPPAPTSAVDPTPNNPPSAQPNLSDVMNAVSAASEPSSAGAGSPSSDLSSESGEGGAAQRHGSPAATQDWRVWAAALLLLAASSQAAGGGGKISCGDRDCGSVFADIVTSFAKKASGLNPGPFAGRSIPASGTGYTPDEQQKVQEIGDETGCHTCGATTPGTKSGKWIPDHQPPSKLNPNNGPQELYPHCLEGVMNL